MVHHSDQGVQYASTDYTDLLQASGITISMSRRGNPYDNATCESFLKTLKYEEVYRSEYRDLDEARDVGTSAECRGEDHLYRNSMLPSHCCLLCRRQWLAPS